jgi:integrase
MSLVPMKHLHTYRSKGSEYTYYRRGKVRVRLPGKPGSAEFLIAYQKAHEQYEATSRPQAERKPFPEKSMGALVAAYKAHKDFSKLPQQTRNGYEWVLKTLPAPTLHFPVASLSSEFITRHIDTMAETPGKANYFIAVLKKVLNWGKRRGWIATNPADGVEKYDAGDSYRAWTDAEIAAFTSPEAGRMALAVLIGLYTGQRLSDALKMPWSAYDGAELTWIQSKIKKKVKERARVTVPVHPALKQALDAAPRTAITICTRVDGHSWKARHFSAVFVATREKLGLADDVHFHGLRHSIASRLAEAGASDAQIQSVTGHQSRQMVELYSSGARQRKMAEAAISMLPTKQTGNKNG